MPDFGYYATWEESIQLLRSLLENQGLSAIPDRRPYDKPKAETHDAITSTLFDELNRRRVVFLCGPFTRYPPTLKKFETGPYAGGYYIDVGSGGPLLQLTLATVNKVDGQPTLVGGMLSRPKYYHDPSTGHYESYPEVQKAFTAAAKTLKAGLVSHKLGSQIWIGAEALRLLKAGQVRIIDNGVLERPA